MSHNFKHEINVTADVVAEYQTPKTESAIQQECYQWFHNTYCLPSRPDEQRYMIFHIPNQNQHKIQSIGLYAGAADLCIIEPVIMRACFIEMKKNKDQDLSVSQLKFAKHVLAMKGDYRVCWSLEMFKELVKEMIPNL